MVNINSRRGAAHRNDQHGCITRLLQAFVAFTVSIIIIGYYYFLSSAISPKNNNSSSSSSSIGVENNDIGSVRGNSVPTSRRVKEHNDNGNQQPKATIGYAITVSGCPKDNGSRGDFGAGISDGAAVLKHSIHLNSIQNYAQSKSLYDYKMYALVHIEAELCARSALEPLGYEILLRDVPVPLNEIEGEYLREKVPANGCCGEKEFVKLHAYTLMQHPAVVHLDLDTLVMKPMDKLYDAMIQGPPKDGTNGGVDVAFGDPLISPADGAAASSGNEINAYFTRDYNMAHSNMKHAGAQGGFLVLRPSMDIYNEFVSIIRKGDFRQNGGWGGLGFGPFYGVSGYRMLLMSHSDCDCCLVVSFHDSHESSYYFSVAPTVHDLSGDHSLFL